LLLLRLLLLQRQTLESTAAAAAAYLLLLLLRRNMATCAAQDAGGGHKHLQCSSITYEGDLCQAASSCPKATNNAATQGISSADFVFKPPLRVLTACRHNVLLIS